MTPPTDTVRRQRYRRAVHGVRALALQQEPGVVPAFGRELLEQLAFLRRSEVRAASAARRRRRPPRAAGRRRSRRGTLVGVVGPRALGPVPHEPLAVPEERIRLLIDVRAGIERSVLHLLHPVRQLAQELARPPSP